MRTPKILMRLAVLLITAGGVLFSDIVYKGNEYAETMMPYSYSGSNENFIVISGSIENYNSSRLSIFEINGVNMNNSSELPAAEDGKKYFIHLKGQNKNASFSVSGINDWSVEQPLDTTAIILPFTKTGAGKYFFSTTDNIGSLTSANMDTLLINNQIFTNQTVTDLPEKDEGYYYIYYSASLSTAAMMIESPAEPEPEIPEFIRYNGNDYTFIEMPWTYIGGSVTRVYTYGKITSFNTNKFITSLEINGQSYTVNQTHTDPPASIGQKYFITIIPKNQKGKFEIDGETKKIVHKLNIKVLLEGAL